MQLLNVHRVGHPDTNHLCIEAGRIQRVVSGVNLLSPAVGEGVLTFENALVFPGLINSHDHLDFDLFPQLGNRVYKNYLEWGADIHLQNKKEINSILAVPEHLRVDWGVYKNLLGGVTTVVNHGKQLAIRNKLINVFQDCQTIHSVKRGKNWKVHLNNIFKTKLPVVIHVGEGTDGLAEKEIDELFRWNYLRRSLIGVHGVAMTARQAPLFRALVWCPCSNDFLLGTTAPVDTLRKRTLVLFGTDSTLTAPWNIWDQLRAARKTSLLTDEALFDTFTVNAADAWQIQDVARIEEGYWADLVVARSPGSPDSMDSFYQINPNDILLVLHKGSIRMFDKELLPQISSMNIDLSQFSCILLGGVEKYVAGDLPALIKHIHVYNPEIPFPVSY